MKEKESYCTGPIVHLVFTLLWWKGFVYSVWFRHHTSVNPAPSTHEILNIKRFAYSSCRVPTPNSFSPMTIVECGEIRRRIEFCYSLGQSVKKTTLVAEIDSILKNLKLPRRIFIISGEYLCQVELSEIFGEELFGHSKCPRESCFVWFNEGRRNGDII